MEKIEQAAVSLYRQGYTMTAIAARLGLSQGKTRKILVTHGLCRDAMTRRIGELHAQGLTDAQIAQMMRINVNSVNSYLPYEKGIYGREKPSLNAIRIRQSRERRKMQGKE